MKSSGRGRALFFGEQPLRARIRDHATDLPSEVVRCTNCHGPTAVATGQAGSSAPRLDPTFLLEARIRRGGPPSAYDRGSFCTLLRTGVDPVHILLAREMPNYRLDESECDALWKFLTVEQAVGPVAATADERPAAARGRRRE